VKQQRDTNLAAVRYWPTWLGIGLLRAAVLLPYPVIMGLGTVVGHIMRLVAPKRVDIADKNLQICYPDMDAKQRRTFIRKNFASMGKGLMEVCMAWWWPRERIEGRLLTIEGEQHLPASDDKKGTIFLTAHFSSLELSGRYLIHRSPSHAMYRPNENPVIQALFERNRTRGTLSIISRNDVRGMIRALRAGDGVWFAPDQNFRPKGAVFADFMGVPAATNPATSRFASLAGARIVPFVLFRVRDGYHLTIEPPLQDFPSEDPQADAAVINRIFEHWTQTAPEQYNWIHRRFKTRPDGGRSPYKKRAPGVVARH